MLATGHLLRPELLHSVLYLCRLTLIEELIINENMLSELPLCTGLLRQLQTLIADCNKIEQLPPSICSCTNLRILSLADNCIKILPEDMGRLSSLQVMNLCNNSLSYLPFSLTKISSLKSLWLSENQNKPLVQFHSEMLPNAYQKVLTCVLLPQSKEDSLEGNSANASNALDQPSNSTRRKSSFLISSIDKPLINFNLSNEEDRTEDAETAKLLRQPTPYPKDLKAHARHARNLVLKHLDLGNCGVPGHLNLENAEKTDEISSKTY